MHMHHDGNEGAQLDPITRRKARIMLSSIVIPMLVLTVIGLFVLYPYGGDGVKKQPYLADGVSRVTGVVTTQPISQCRFKHGVDSPDLIESAVCAKVLSGKGEGTVVPVHIPPENKGVVRPGTKLKMFFDSSAVNQGTPYIYEDVERSFPIWILVGIYLAVVVLVAGRRGAAALVGLVTSVGVIFLFMIPALISGKPALLVTLVGAGAMMFLSVYLAHGVTIRTTTALLGTFIGLAITMGLATVGVDKAGLSGASSEDALSMMTYFPNVSLSALLMCGIVIAGLGALNDVAITQASAVWELFEANPTMPSGKLFSRAMRIGRDHIASTVYTLAFAYAGTALPTFIIASMIERPVMDLVLSSAIAEEIVRTLVASIGLVLAIPATTVIGTFFVTWIHATNSPDVRTTLEQDM